MYKTQSLWTRIAGWMNPAGPSNVGPRLGEPDYSTELPETTQGNGKTTSSMLPWRKRDEAIEQMRAGYDEVISLVKSIQSHLAAQNDRSDQVVALLGEVAKGIREIPARTQQSAEALDRLASQMEATSRHTQIMAAAIGDMPKATMAQKEALNDIADQLAVSTQTTDQLTQRLDSLGQVVKMMNESSAQQVRTLQSVQSASEAQSEKTTDLLSTQTRRLTVFFALTIVLAIAAIIVGSISMLSQG